MPTSGGRLRGPDRYGPDPHRRLRRASAYPSPSSRRNGAMSAVALKSPRRSPRPRRRCGPPPAASSGKPRECRCSHCPIGCGHGAGKVHRQHGGVDDHPGMRIRVPSIGSAYPSMRPESTIGMAAPDPDAGRQRCGHDRPGAGTRRRSRRPTGRRPPPASSPGQRRRRRRRSPVPRRRADQLVPYRGWRSAPGRRPRRSGRVSAQAGRGNAAHTPRPVPTVTASAASDQQPAPCSAASSSAAHRRRGRQVRRRRGDDQDGMPGRSAGSGHRRPTSAAARASTPSSRRENPNHLAGSRRSGQAPQPWAPDRAGTVRGSAAGRGRARGTPGG